MNCCGFGLLVCMMDGVNQIIFALSAQIEVLIREMGYLGVVLLMAIESFNIPLPSEVILTFTGFLVSQGVFNIHFAALAGAIGCVVGSIPSYALGYYGGRPFLERYGKWLLLTHHDLEASEGWVNRYADVTFFVCRMLPIVRTFISLPAGILRVRFVPFVIYTFIGSWVWSYALIWVGMKVGEHQEAFKQLWHKFDALIIATALILLGLYIYKHVTHFRDAGKAPLPKDPVKLD